MTLDGKMSVWIYRSMRGIERAAAPKTARGEKSTLARLEEKSKRWILISRIRCGGGEGTNEFMMSATAGRYDQQPFGVKM